MAKPGPAAKPVELKVLEGNRGNRPLDLSTVFRPQAGAPTAPAWLSKEGKKAWKRLSVELVRYNLLATVDRDAFAALCQTIGRVEQIETAIQAKQALLISQGKDPTDALMDVTPNGLRIQSALYQLLNKEQAKQHTFLNSFGLRPDARAAVTTAMRAQASLFDAKGNASQGALPLPEEPQAPAAPAATPTVAPAPPAGALPQSFGDF